MAITRTTKPFEKAIRRNYLIATGLVVFTGPYVFATNTGASATLIWQHIGLMWLLAPGLITAFEKWLIDFQSPEGSGDTARKILAQFAGISVAAVLTVLLLHLTSGIAFGELLSPPLLVALTPSYFGYALATFVEMNQAAKRQNSALQMASLQAQWSALNAKIQPHFLFNTLTNIEELIDQNPAKAKEMLSHLAKLYRGVLEQSEKQSIALRDELALVEHYFSIQAIRWQDSLIIDRQITEAVLASEIPPTILLTLAENAFKHGWKLTSPPLHLKLTIAAGDGTVVITLANKFDDQPILDSRGYGLEDIATRLNLFAGKDAGVSLKTEANWLIATVRV